MIGQWAHCHPSDGFMQEDIAKPWRPSLKSNNTVQSVEDCIVLSKIAKHISSTISFNVFTDDE